jgi:hypothetical protein
MIASIAGNKNASASARGAYLSKTIGSTAKPTKAATKTVVNIHYKKA